jgi:hypothetical protein
MKSGTMDELSSIALASLPQLLRLPGLEVSRT